MEINILLSAWNILVTLKIPANLTLGGLLKQIFTSKDPFLPYDFSILEEGSKVKERIATHLDKPLQQLSGTYPYIELLFPYSKIQTSMLKESVLQGLAEQKMTASDEVRVSTHPSGHGILHYKIRFGVLKPKDLILYKDQINFQLKEDLKTSEYQTVGATPLHIAALYDVKPYLIKLLVSKGANLNVQDSLGNTALHYTAKANDDASVSLLLQLGANLNIPNNEGQFPLELMTSGKETEILLSHGRQFLPSIPSGQNRDKWVEPYRQYFIDPLFAELILDPSLRPFVTFRNILNIISSFISVEEKEWKKLLSYPSNEIEGSIVIRKINNTLENLKKNALERDCGNLLIQGPLPVKNATLDFSCVVRAFIYDIPIFFDCDINTQDIVASIAHCFNINITRMLAEEPDVDQIKLSDTELQRCYTYFIPMLNGKKITRVESEFKKNEYQYGIDSQTLHPAEKLAIYLYSRSEYIPSFHELINYFFRNLKIDSFSELKPIFLLGTVVTHALSRLPDTEGFVHEMRIEDASDIPSRINILKKNSIVYEKPLLSTYGLKYKEFFYECLFLFGKNPMEIRAVYYFIKNYKKKCIQVYSEYSDENEILFGIGTKFILLDSFKDSDGREFFVYTPFDGVGIKTKPVPLSQMISQTLLPAPKLMPMTNFNGTAVWNGCSQR